MNPWGWHKVHTALCRADGAMRGSTWHSWMLPRKLQRGMRPMGIRVSVVPGMVKADRYCVSHLMRHDGGHRRTLVAGPEVGPILNCGVDAHRLWSGVTSHTTQAKLGVRPFTKVRSPAGGVQGSQLILNRSSAISMNSSACRRKSAAISGGLERRELVSCPYRLIRTQHSSQRPAKRNYQR